MKLIGTAADKDGTLLYPRELAAARAKCDPRILDKQITPRSGVDALAEAHEGPGRKPKVGYSAEEVEGLRTTWFEDHEAIDPDEVTGVTGSSRSDALSILRENARLRAILADYLDSSFHAGATLMSSARTAAHAVGWEPPG